MIKRIAHTMVCIVALTLAVTAGAAAAADFTPGWAGLGDPMFPCAGNGGYDVGNYNLTLDYRPSSNQLAGAAVISATATQTCRASTSTSAGRRTASRACS